MPDFVYESMTANGQTHTGVLTAADRADAVRQLVGRGETATSILAAENGKAERSRRDKPRAASTARAGTAGRSGQKAGPKAGQKAGMFSFGRGVSNADMASLIRELATAVEAGLPLMQSLRTVRRQVKAPAMMAVLDHMIERVEAGDQLHVAARDLRPLFTDMMIGMLQAADASGEMAGVLHQLADLLERQLELKREVMGATMYPMIVAGLIVISVIVLVTVLVPQLIEPLAGQITLPWPTRVLLNVAGVLQAYWIYFVIAIVTIIIAIRAWLNVPANRVTYDRFKLRVPVLGQLLRDVAVARFTRTLGTLTNAGLPILDSLRITRNTLGNAALMEAVDEVQDEVTSGKSLADPLERSGLFPPMLIQVVNLGERSGRLEGMLLHAAGAFDRRVNTSLKMFTKALPPFLIMVMASIGGFVLAAILLPLMELQSAFN